MKKALLLSYPCSAQWRLWSDCDDAQADLSLCWAHRTFCWFCQVAARMSSHYHMIIVLYQKSILCLPSWYRTWLQLKASQLSIPLITYQTLIHINLFLYKCEHNLIPEWNITHYLVESITLQSILKSSDTKNICCNHPKICTRMPIHPKDATV